MATVLAQPLALLDIRFETRRWLEKEALRQRLAVAAALEIDHIETIKRAVRAGGVVSVLPDYAVLADALAGELAIVELEGASRATTATVLLTRKGRLHTRAAKAEIELFVNAAPG